VALEPVGHYGVQPQFSDGHNSGIFSWDYLYGLGQREAELWLSYDLRLKAAGVGRDDPMGSGASPACHSH